MKNIVIKKNSNYVSTIYIGSRFFGYIKVAWQQYNYKLQRGLESTSLLFSRSVSVNNIYPTTSVKHDILAATFLYLGKFLSYQQKLMFV